MDTKLPVGGRSNPGIFDYLPDAVECHNCAIYRIYFYQQSLSLNIPLEFLLSFFVLP